MASTILRLFRFFTAFLVWYVEDVQSACPTMNDVTGNGQVRAGAKAELADFSSSRSMTLSDYQGQVVAHLENPGVFWDASSTMYDCNDNRLLEIKWPPANLLMHPQQKEYKVVLHNGNVADLHVKRTTTPRSEDLFIVKVSGTDVLEFSAEFKSSFEKGFGWFGRYKTVSYEVLPGALVLPGGIDAMLNDARFVYLVSAFMLAPNGNGPIWFVLPFLLPCLLCCVLFCIGYGANLCNSFCHNQGLRQQKHTDFNAGQMTEAKRKWQSIEDQQKSAHLEQVRKQKGLLAWFSCCRDKKNVYPAETNHLLPQQALHQQQHGHRRYP